MDYENGGKPPSFDARFVLPGEQSTIWQDVGNGSFAFVTSPHHPEVLEITGVGDHETRADVSELYNTDDHGIGPDVSIRNIGTVAFNGAKG